jgi:hypothetical protein
MKNDIVAKLISEMVLNCMEYTEAGGDELAICWHDAIRDSGVKNPDDHVRRVTQYMVANLVEDLTNEDS